VDRVRPISAEGYGQAGPICAHKMSINFNEHTNANFEERARRSPCHQGAPSYTVQLVSCQMLTDPSLAVRPRREVVNARPKSWRSVRSVRSVRSARQPALLVATRLRNSANYSAHSGQHFETICDPNRSWSVATGHRKFYRKKDNDQYITPNLT